MLLVVDLALSLFSSPAPSSSSLLLSIVKSITSIRFLIVDVDDDEASGLGTVELLDDPATNEFDAESSITLKIQSQFLERWV